MKQNFIIAIVLFILPTLVYAQTGDNYDLSWSIVAGGGGTSSGQSYILESTIGQMETGSVSGGNYIVVGGFWGGEGPGEAPGNSNVYLPVILRE